jgi:hypothetical protein
MRKQVEPVHEEHWESEAEWRVAWLKRLCRVPGDVKPDESKGGGRKTGKFLEFDFEAEPGIGVTTRWEGGSEKLDRLAVVLDLGGADVAWKSNEYARAKKSGWDVAVIELRATGEGAPRGNQVRRALDHNASQWAMWIGRPLITQWVTDIRRTLDQLARFVYRSRLPRVRVVGRGAAGSLAVVAAAVDSRIHEVQTVGAPVSVISDQPYGEGPLGVLIPGSLHTIGDLPQMMSLLAPRPLKIVDPVSAGGEPLDGAAATVALKHTRTTYRVLKAERALTVEVGTTQR